MTKTYRIQCRNNADAVRIGNRSVRVPGAVRSRHLGRKTVLVTSVEILITEKWLDSAHEVESWTVEETV